MTREREREREEDREREVGSGRRVNGREIDSLFGPDDRWRISI